MGLCKCRNVTNLFCFEHRKNVCEKCIVSDHNKCVVKSYLQWLQDSDYDATCQICTQPLEQGELLRLTCLDIFHLKCINEVCGKLPETTAPAGYTCPVCNAGVIPADNNASQIAENVRLAFAGAKWAQNVLPKKGAEPRVDVGVPKNSHVVTSPVSKPILESSSVSIDAGLPPKKLTTKSSSLRDADDDKYGKVGNDRATASWNPKSRWLSPKRLGLVLGFALFLIIFLYYFII